MGEKLEIPGMIEVAGYSPLSVELHYVRGEPDAAVRIACAGTVVCESVRDLGGLDVDPDPWVGRELVGVVDFPDLNVPPGTRRGIVPDEAAHSFVAALAELRVAVMSELDRFARERDRSAQRDLAKELRRALRGFAQRLPQYELPVVTEPTTDGHAAHASRSGEVERSPTADDLPPGVGVADAADEAPTEEVESFRALRSG